MFQKKIKEQFDYFVSIIGVLTNIETNNMLKYNYLSVDDNGKTTSVGESKFVKNNIYGIYAGSENPKLPKLGGSADVVYDDYSLAPIDEVDAVAKKHDLAYDKQNIVGFDGVMSDASTKANLEAANEAGDVMSRYQAANKKGDVAVDKVSGKPITQSEFEGAMKIHDGFKAAEVVKDIKRASKKASENGQKIEQKGIGPKY